MTRKAIAKEVGVWFLTLLLVLWMCSAGLTKFSSHSDWIRMFQHFGFPDWFRILIGIIEVATVPLLFVPRTAAYAAGTIAVIMIGAIVTVAVHDPIIRILPAAIVLVIASVVLKTRWRQRFVFDSERPSADNADVTQIRSS
jgi:putative oxidoreductase